MKKRRFLMKMHKLVKIFFHSKKSLNLGYFLTLLVSFMWLFSFIYIANKNGLGDLEIDLTLALIMLF